MIGTSKIMIYAIETVLDIAYNSSGETVQSAAICERQGIPRRYLEPVLQQLVRAGILSGVRGPRGGYRLAKERALITVGDIARVVDAIETSAGETQPRSDIGRKVVLPLCRQTRAETLARLDEITIEALCRRASGTGVASEALRRLDYSI